jgi:hypothetical protein
MLVHFVDSCSCLICNNNHKWIKTFRESWCQMQIWTLFICNLKDEINIGTKSHLNILRKINDIVRGFQAVTHSEMFARETLYPHENDSLLISSISSHHICLYIREMASCMHDTHPVQLVIHNICLSMALLPSVGPWPLFQFLNPIHSRYDSFDVESARRKAATYT